MIEWQSLVCIHISVYQGKKRRERRRKEISSKMKYNPLNIAYSSFLLFDAKHGALFFFCSPKNKATNVTRIVDDCTAWTRWETTQIYMFFIKERKEKKKMLSNASCYFYCYCRMISYTNGITIPWAWIYVKKRTEKRTTNY